MREAAFNLFSPFQTELSGGFRISLPIKKRIAFGKEDIDFINLATNEELHIAVKEPGCF